MSYYILQNDETKGPYTVGQLRSMWNSGALTGDTLYCEEGFEGWLHLRVMADQLEVPPASSHPIMRPPPIPAVVVAQPRKPSGIGKVLGFGFLGMLGLLALLMLLRVPGLVSDTSGNAGRSQTTDKTPFPTDPATLQKMEAAIAGYKMLGVFTKIQSYPGDQVWVYVSDSFYKQLTIDDKHRAVAIVYSFYHSKDSVDFVMLYDAYSGKTVGRYKPSLGLTLE